MSMTGACRATIYAQIAEGTLPTPVKLSRKFACWPEEEIAQVIRARIAGKSIPQVQALVSTLVEQRKELAS